MSDDVLAARTPAEVAGFYRRLAAAVERDKGTVKVSLAAMLMNHWLDNRDRNAIFEFDPPDHLVSSNDVVQALLYHRDVYLTKQRARLDGSSSRWVGILPRLQGSGGFRKWDGRGVLKLDYQSLVELPMYYQLTGSHAERDLLYSLHGFQLKSMVEVTVGDDAREGRKRVSFVNFQAQVLDTYNWDYTEHLKTPNPDYGSHDKGAIEPGSKVVRVYHSNAKRVEDAGLAAPYALRSRPWKVTDLKITGPAQVDPERRL